MREGLVIVLFLPLLLACRTATCTCTSLPLGAFCVCNRLPWAARPFLPALTDSVLRLGRQLHLPSLHDMSRPPLDLHTPAASQALTLALSTCWTQVGSLHAGTQHEQPAWATHLTIPALSNPALRLGRQLCLPARHAVVEQTKHLDVPAAGQWRSAHLQAQQAEAYLACMRHTALATDKSYTPLSSCPLQSILASQLAAAPPSPACRD